MYQSRRLSALRHGRGLVANCKHSVLFGKQGISLSSSLPCVPTRFCPDSRTIQSTSGTLQLTSSDPSVYGCAPISLSMSTSPPPQALPRCGDYPINTPLYLSGPNPQNPANSVIYGRAEDGNINFSGSSPLYRTDMSTMATPFIFDEQCSLIRITAAGTRATSTIGSV